MTTRKPAGSWRLNMAVFVIHSVGWAVIAMLPRHQQWVSAFAGVVSGAAGAFALATWLDNRGEP